MRFNLNYPSLFYFKLLFKELVSPLNYLIALLIGIIINYFQGIGIFASAVSYVVPVIVQSISKASVKYSNRNQALLVKLPRERLDPAFVMAKDGLVLVCEGKSKKILAKNNINHFADIFSNNSKEDLEKCIRRSKEKGSAILEELYSPKLLKWYDVHLKADSSSGSILVWLQDISQRKELDEKLKGLRDFFTTMLPLLDYPYKINGIDQIAAQLLTDGYSTIYITKKEASDLLSGHAYRIAHGKVEKSELICDESDENSAIWASRKNNEVVYHNYSLNGDSDNTNYIFHPKLKTFLNVPVQNFINFHEGEISIIALNKNNIIKKYDVLFFEAVVHSAFTLIHLINKENE